MGGFGKLKKKVYRCLVGQVSCGFGPYWKIKVSYVRTWRKGKKSVHPPGKLLLIVHSLSEFIIIVLVSILISILFFLTKTTLFPTQFSHLPTSLSFGLLKENKLEKNMKSILKRSSYRIWIEGGYNLKYYLEKIP